MNTHSLAELFDATRLKTERFFDCTQFAATELADLEGCIVKDLECFRQAYSRRNIVEVARAADDLSRHLLQSFKMLDPIIAALEDNGELQAMVAAEKAAT
jgi:hypothetical protein